MSVIRFYSGPVKFTLGWLDRIDKLIRQHLTQQGLLMKRGMATSRQDMSPDDMGMGLKGCVGVYLLELVRLLLQYKWGTIFRQEWFWRGDGQFTRGQFTHPVPELSHEPFCHFFHSMLQWDWFHFSNRPFEKRNGPENSELICF